MPNLFPSGPWTGYYLENHRPERGWMHLFLEFEGKLVRGEGTDYVGPWTLSGEFDDSSGHCQWQKQYVGQHRVLYRGQLGSEGIQGRWEMDSGKSSTFQIWPASMTHLSQKYLTEGPDQGLDSGGRW